MSTENAITVIGNLTADPELRYTQSGTAVVNCRVAVNRRAKEGDEWVDKLDGYFTVNAWRDIAENIAESLKKGDRVVVMGSLKSRSYEANGETKWVTEIEADEVCPSLRWARCSVSRVGKSGGSGRQGGVPSEPMPQDVPFLHSYGEV